jgi:hypothetical protein
MPSFLVQFFGLVSGAGFVSSGWFDYLTTLSLEEEGACQGSCSEHCFVDLRMGPIS